jgi:hypothetical protein
MGCGPRTAALALGLALLAPATPARGGAALARETSLRSAAGGEERVAFLTPATPIEVVETRDGWVRVRIEGWVPAGDIAGAGPAGTAPAAAAATAGPTPVTPPPPAPTPSAPPPAAPVTPPPALAPPAVVTESASGRLAAAGTSVIEGTIRVQLSRLKKRVGAGATVLLLPAETDLETTDAATALRLAELEAEALRLEREAEWAMQHTSNFTEATAKRDALMAQRAEVLDKRQNILATEHGRHEQTARTAAVAQALADSKGWFRIESVPAGGYTLYTRMTRDGTDLEWIEPLTVGTGPVQVTLDETRARGMLPRASD